MRFKLLPTLLAFLLTMLLSACGSGDTALVDELNEESYAWHYRNLDSTKVYAYRLCKAQHLNGHGDRNRSPIHIPQINSLMKMTGYIILQLSISN